MNDNRPFPIQHEYSRNERGEMERHAECTIPWWLAEIAYEWYSRQYGTIQSLERLAERGGFGRKELLMLIRHEA
jgi:hypothetical protein